MTPSLRKISPRLERERRGRPAASSTWTALFMSAGSTSTVSPSLSTCLLASTFLFASSAITSLASCSERWLCNAVRSSQPVSSRHSNSVENARMDMTGLPFTEDW
ncbi:hypothetical protein D3C84_685460 [compost metagenome]